MNYWLIESIGYIAMVCILAGYFLISTAKVDGKSKLFHGLNLVGSALFVFYLAIRRAWPSMSLNAIFVLIATYALIFTCRKKED